MHRLGSGGKKQQFAKTSNRLTSCSIPVQSLDSGELKWAMSVRFKVSSGEGKVGFPCFLLNKGKKEEIGAHM